MGTELLLPPSPGSFDCFSLTCSRGRGPTAAAVTLDTVADETRKKMADGVARSRARLCSRDVNLCHYGCLEYDFVAFVPCSLRFLFPPSLSRYVYLVRVPSPVKQSFATLSKYVVRIISFWCHLYPASSRNSFAFYLLSIFS